MKKLLITLITVCTILFTFGMINASAATSGTCGDNLTWTLDDSGKLTISGQGSMTNWSWDSTAPWFSSREDIVRVVIGDGVTGTGRYAFYKCSNLRSITIPDSVTTIDFYTFSYCNSLASITIPDSVTSIDNCAFYNCSNLVNITIPDSVTSIGRSAFSGCSSIESITIPDSVTSIGEWAFSDCSSLVRIRIPNGVTNIGKEVFMSCSSLESITIPDSVTSIDKSAFSYCENLTSITIPDSVTSIGDSAFYDCYNLTDVYYNGTEEEWNKISIGSGNELLANATIHYKKVEYRINEITIREMSGNNLQTIPTGTFLATISFTNVSSDEDTVIVLAQYTEDGTFKGLMYIQTEDVPIGSTLKISIPVDNSKGDVAKLKAFCWEAFGSLAPMGDSVSFPKQQ